MPGLRLSRVVASVRSWAYSRTQYARALRRVTMWQLQARNWRVSAKAWKARAEQLEAAVIEQERELAASRRECDRLTSQLDCAKVEIRGLATAYKRLQTMLEARMATDKAHEIHASNGYQQRTALEDYS